MTTFTIEAFAAECKQGMAAAASPELGARECLEKLLAENDLDAVAAVLEAAIPPDADVGEMIVHTSPELTMLYARVPARFQSGIHNHTVFACIGQLEGTEASTLYEKTAGEDRLAVSGTLTVRAGEVISLAADAIHDIENPDDTTARSLHLYGGDFNAVMDERSLWDAESHAETSFNFQELLRQSIRTMKGHNNRVGLEAVAEAIPATRPLIDA